MVSPQVANEVGSRLGEVEEVEWKRRKDDINFFMRVQVALSILKPLQRGGGCLLLVWTVIVCGFHV